MSAFNPHHLIRQIPATTWQRYFTARSMAVPDDVDWAGDENAVSDSLITLLDALPPAQQAYVHAELRHVHHLATSKGMEALLNASDNDGVLREAFGTLRTHAERALWVLIHWPHTFMAAEALLQFDKRVGKRSWKRHTIKITEPVSRETADIEALQGALSVMFSQRQKVPRACQVDICDRYLDGGVQVSVYLEEDPNDLVEFIDQGMRRRTTRPATTLALVYYPTSGIIDTVGPGGAKIHQPLVTLFARHLLKQEVKPESVQQPMFYLNRLRHGLDLPENSPIDLEALGIRHLRLRRARLKSMQAPLCEFWVGVPADHGECCVLSASQRHLKEHDLFRGAFHLVEAHISVYFMPDRASQRGRVVNIELKHSGISNLRDLDEQDAKLAEQLLCAWRIAESPQMALPLAA